MSFSAFSQPPLRDLINDARDTPKLSLLLGAGTSIEAGLPSWSALIERLLVRAGTASGTLTTADEDGTNRWVAEAVRRDGYLGAAAIVEALAEDGQLGEWIPLDLYGERSPSDFFPGPIAQQLPRLVDAFGTDLEIFTTNYDDLAEQALRDDPVSPRQAAAYVGEHLGVGADVVQVRHLHGYAGRDGQAGTLVLSEADYQRMQQGASWQANQVGAALANSMFVFVGSSLADPNLLRYLYGEPPGNKPPRYAIFVRQDTYEPEVPDGVRKAREAAVRSRWGAVGVTVVFVDHYVEVAQALSEMARAKRLGESYVPLPDRAATWVTTVNDRLLGLAADETFQRAQSQIVTRLREALQAAVAAAERLEQRQWDETLALTLWLVDEPGEHLINRATTDRLHIDRATIEPVHIDEYARWVAVRAYCRGKILAESRETYASRWHFIRGLPLVIDDDEFGRIPVGCVTVTSMKRRDETMLNAIDDAVEAGFNRALRTAIYELLAQPFRH
ncbi:SIR2 family protein [Paraconexibacter algicola]|uniref:SIR2 family protein n=1 Tax=Paraconexibacter algicola TaxID=2133960 RepID=UPI001304E8B6|nr:SIR2 family protein [Paraconexibacter algicola]